MKSVPELNLGSVDAINYRTRQQKEFFARILYRERYLEEILENSRYFLIGEKGTGKTSYAVFLSNSDYKTTKSEIVSLTETDYRRFAALVRKGDFSSVSFTEIWKTTLLLLISGGILDKFGASVLGFPQFNIIHDVINKYYDSSFKKAVDQSLDFIENVATSSKMMRDAYAEKTADTVTNTNVSISFLERKFKEAIRTLKLDHDFIFFIDGIDIRPGQIDYPAYIECIRGLANAAWELNTGFFSNIRDTKKHIKVVLLLRPDILDNMGFQNLNAKVRDNGIVLNWATSYDAYSNSALFQLVAGTLAKQQFSDNQTNLDVWRHYFPYDLENLRLAGVVDDPFVGFLRYSFYRPRDIVQYLKLMQDFVISSETDKSVFSRESFFRSQIDFSDYLLGEVKDYLSSTTQPSILTRWSGFSRISVVRTISPGLSSVMRSTATSSGSKRAVERPLFRN